MKLKYLVIYTLFAGLFIIAKPQNAFAQTYICGAGPGPGEIMVGMTQGGNGIASEPICAQDNSQNSNSNSNSYSVPKSHGASINNYISCASHPSSLEPWCGINFRTKEEAEKSVLDACNKDMGKGCNSFGSAANTFVIIGRNKEYQICLGSGQNREIALKSFQDYCKAQNGYKIINEYSAMPWHEAKFGDVAPVYHTPSGYYHLSYGAVANVKNHENNGKFKNEFFISTGLKTKIDAQENAIKYCKDETKKVCEISFNAVPNGNINFQINSDQKVIIAWGNDYDDAKLNGQNDCKKLEKTCVSRASYSINEEFHNSSIKIKY